MLGECPNFQGGMDGWKNQGKWTKNRGSLAMRMRKWENLAQNFGKSPWYLFSDIELQFCCIIKEYIPKSKI